MMSIFEISEYIECHTLCRRTHGFKVWFNGAAVEGIAHDKMLTNPVITTGKTRTWNIDDWCEEVYATDDFSVDGAYTVDIKPGHVYIMRREPRPLKASTTQRPLGWPHILD